MRRSHIPGHTEVWVVLECFRFLPSTCGRNLSDGRSEVTFSPENGTCAIRGAVQGEAATLRSELGKWKKS